MISIEQRERLRALLDVNKQALEAVVAQLAGAGVVSGSMDEARREIGDVRAAQRRAERIGHFARDLDALLAEERLAGDLLAAFDIDISREDRGARLQRFRGDLQTLSATAARIADDDATLRIAHLLPLAKDMSRSSVSIAVWPLLFTIWEEAGKKLTQTPNGGLHQFVSLAHEILGLAAPSAFTLRDAVRSHITAARQVSTASR